MRGPTLLAASLFIAACAAGKAPDGFIPIETGELPDAGAPDTAPPPVLDAETPPSLGDGLITPPNVTPDAACASAAAEAKTEPLPVDIIWMVDNSSSMAPAVAQVRAGLNDFANAIAAKSLDYKVIMLSLRDPATSITLGGSARYPVCITPPLAGDANCGNGTRFFQSSIDIKSTQPLEQFLGTMDQTEGYKVGEQRGGEDWKPALRANATKTIVVVSDDNSRFAASDFETFAGGTNPSTASLQLPPGILDPSRNGSFAGYVFAAIYGWGSDTDPGATCTYSDGTHPANAGSTYTSLVKKTGGPRAKLCDGAAAWAPFFDAIAQAVVKSSKVACDVDIPAPPSGTLDATKVNVQIDDGTKTTLVPKVANAAACGTDAGWYYDNDANPTKVLLCPSACDAANAQIGTDKIGKLQVLFGCTSVVK